MNIGSEQRPRLTHPGKIKILIQYIHNTPVKSLYSYIPPRIQYPEQVSIREMSYGAKLIESQDVWCVKQQPGAT